MSPETPFLAAGAVTLIGGTARHKGLPENALVSTVGTVALVIVASATSGTPIAPLVRAIGLLVLLSAIMAAVPYITKG